MGKRRVLRCAFELVWFQVWNWRQLWLTQRRWAVKSCLTSWIDALSRRISQLTAHTKTEKNVRICLCVHRYTNTDIIPSSCLLTGSEGIQRRLPEWRDLSSQPVVSGKAWPLKGAIAFLLLWETWRSRGWVPPRPTERTTVFSQVEYRIWFSCKYINKYKIPTATMVKREKRKKGQA